MANYDVFRLPSARPNAPPDPTVPVPVDRGCLHATSPGSRPTSAPPFVSRPIQVFCCISATITIMSKPLTSSLSKALLKPLSGLGPVAI